MTAYELLKNLEKIGEVMDLRKIDVTAVKDNAGDLRVHDILSGPGLYFTVYPPVVGLAISKRPRPRE